MATKAQIDIVLQAINRSNNLIDRVSGQIDGLRRAEVKANRTAKVLATTHRRVEASFRRTARAARRLSTGLIAAAAAYAGLRSIDNLLAPAIEMEQFEAQFALLLGSLEQGQQRLAELVDFAAATPFELPGILRASKTLETLTKGALSTGDGLKLVADVAAVTGEPIDQIALHVGRLYDGLQSGRPVGESAMRLQELGVISGETRNRIEDLTKEGKKGPEVWNELSTSLERFSGLTDALSKTAGTQITNISDNFYKLRTALFSDVRDALTPRLIQLNDQLDKLANSERIEKIGNSVAAIFDMIIEAWQQDQLDELIVLSLKAAFEQASNFLRRTFHEDFTWVSNLVQSKLINAFLEAPIDFAFWMRGLANKGGTFFLTIFETITSYLTETISFHTGKLIHELKSKTTEFVNFFIENLTRQINAVIRLLNRLPGIAVDPFDGIDPVKAPGAFTAQPPTGFFEKWVEIDQRRQVELEKILSQLKEQEERFKRIFQIGQDDLDLTEERTTATEKLAKAYREAAKRIELLKVAGEKEKEAIISETPRTTPNENAAPNNNNDDGPKIVDRYKQLGEDLQIIAKDMSAVMAAPFEGMFYGVSQAIEGLIMRTMTWRDALMNIGSAILGSVVSAIAAMAAAWLTSQLMMALGMKSMAAASAASSAAMGAGVAAAWLPAAISASIATFGGAAATGAAAFAAAMASGSASAVLFGGLASAALGGISAASAGARAFRKGGLVTGPEQTIRINEDGQEYVVNSDGTAEHFGLLQMINAGASVGDLAAKIIADHSSIRMPDLRFAAPQSSIGKLHTSTMTSTSSTVPHTATGAKAANLSVAFLDKRQSVKDWLSSAAGRRYFINMARANRTEIGIPG